MKKIILITGIVILALLTNAQVVNIPDANFKAALLSHNPVIDTNGDGEIQVAEAEVFTGTLYLQNRSISSLTGIESFTVLTSLNCGSNQLTTIDVSNNTSLTNFSSYSNQLTSLDISNNTALTSMRCDNNQLTSLDVSNNMALTSLNCHSNQLSALDVSNNTALIDLICYSNQLTSLDVSNNIALDYLTCYSNQLTSLDVSNNTALTDLICYSNQLSFLDLSNNAVLADLICRDNQLSSLDVSNNTVLTRIVCSNNQLSSLDVSNNTVLNYLTCNSNQLNNLNVKNGNNVNFTYFWAHNNPTLFCIEVDDSFWSAINWTNIDSQTSFGSNCLYGIVDPNVITGKVLIDNNCTTEGAEQGINGIIIKTEPNDFYSITNSFGEYIILTDTGTYQIKQILTEENSLLISPLCPDPNYHMVSFDTLAQDTSGINFYNEAILCPYLTIDLNSNRRRRCFQNHTYINYCNEGYADASGVEIHVQFPEFVNFLSTNYPSYSIDTLGNYVFDIGDLLQGECGSIHIIDSVSCEYGITGLTQCTKAWITPHNDCVEALDTIANNEWDKSSVMVEGECVNGLFVNFTIINTGDFGEGDMQSSSEYRIYADNELVYTGAFQLNGGENMLVEVPANGQTIRLEADQHPAHPGNSQPNAVIEACGDSEDPISLGFVNMFPMDDADSDIEIDCMEIRDSFDPNDKAVSPQGATANNYLMPGTILEYLIRFQNTGSDTAYTVIVVDTLSANLDLSTIQWGISSHPYTIDVTGQGQAVLSFTFSNINLPDSTTDEANSHGFVKFKIAPYDTLAMGTEINNTADIYFDYNLPVRTNTPQVIISDTVLTGDPIDVIIVTNINADESEFFRVMPNPFSEQIDVVFEKYSSYEIKIFDLLGKELQSTNFKGKQKTLRTSKLVKGTYIVQILSEDGVRTEKIVKQ